MAGITSDANVLTTYLREVAQWSVEKKLYVVIAQVIRSVHAMYRYLQQYQECIPVEQLVMQLCDIKQAYTQYGGMYT